jgi:hypothetical protein
MRLELSRLWRLIARECSVMSGATQSGGKPVGQYSWAALPQSQR